MVMTVGLPLCVWYVVKCCVHRVIVVRQSLMGSLWELLLNMPTSVGLGQVYFSGMLEYIDKLIHFVTLRQGVAIVECLTNDVKGHYYVQNQSSDTGH